MASIGDKNISGLKKDVVNVMPLDTVAVDFVADNPGDTLMHCHMQLHMDFGFMQLVRYATRPSLYCTSVLVMGSPCFTSIVSPVRSTLRAW